MTLPWRQLLFGAACALVGYWGSTKVWDHAARKWRARADSLDLRLAISDAELTRWDADRTRYQMQIASLVKAAVPLPPERPAAPRPAPKVGTPSDSAAFWKAQAVVAQAEADQLRADNLVLRQEAERRGQQIQAMARLEAVQDSSLEAVRADRDSLRKLVHAAPVGRPHGIRLPIIGLRLCPVVGPGMSAVLDQTRPDSTTGGHRVVHVRASISVVQPFSCGSTGRTP